MDPASVLGGALTSLAGEIVAGGARAGWRQVFGRAESRALVPVIAEALHAAVEASMRSGVSADARWWEGVASVLGDVLRDEVGWILNPSFDDAVDENRRRGEFEERARRALCGRDRDGAQLEEILDVDQFVWVLPDALRNELYRAAVRDGGPLRDRLSLEFLGTLAAGVRRERLLAPSPRQLRADIGHLLLEVDREVTRADRLPRYLPIDTDIGRMNRPVKVWRELRRHEIYESELDPDQDPIGEERTRRAYRQPGDRADGPSMSWLDLIRAEPRVVLLADPGMGKSWLIRTETHRLARAALDALTAGTAIDELAVPVAVRCDELARTDGESIGESLVQVLGSRLRLPPSARQWLAAHIGAGRAVILLDAWDELPGRAEQNRIKDLLAGLPETDEDNPTRCVLTSRIAGYTGSPLPRPVAEVELLPFEPGDIEAVLAAWSLPAEADRRLRSRLDEPAFAGMARNPLLLALLCSVAEERKLLPTVRWQLYETVVGRFLTRDRARPASGAGPHGQETTAKLLRVLGQVAVHFAILPDGWADEMGSDELADVLSNLPQFTSLETDAYDFIKELADAGLLTPAGSQADGQSVPYRFVHRTIGEYLIARQLTRQEWLPVVEEHLWFDADWSEVIPMLGGQLDDPTRLLDYLLEVPDDPFHLALRMAARVVAELPSPTKMGAARSQIERVVDRLLALLPVHRFHHDPGPGAAVKTALATMAPRVPAPTLNTILDRLTKEAEDNWISSTLQPVLGGAVHRSEVRRALLRQLDKPDDWSSRHGDAVEALAGATDYPEVRQTLCRLVDHEQTLMRHAAVKALAGAVHHDDVLPALAERLDDPERMVRDAAQDALKDVVGERPVVRQAFLALLHTDPEESVRWRAATALAQAAHHHEVRVALLERLTDDDEDEDEDSYVRSSAATALAGAIEHEDVRRSLLSLLAGQTDPELQARVLDTLAGAVDHDDVRSMLLEKLTDQYATVRRSAERGLAKYLHFQDVRDPLLSLATGHPNAEVREAAVRLLAGTCDQEQVRTATLGRLREDPDIDVRKAAARALAGSAGVHDKDLRALGLQLWSLGDPRMWLTAARVWTELPTTQEHQDAWVDLLSQDPDEAVRSEAMHALAGELDSADVRRACLHQLENSSSLLREQAMQMLATVVDHEDVQQALFLRLRDDQHGDVRREAAKAFATTDLDETLQYAMVDLIHNHSNEDVRAAAVKALAGSLHHERPCQVIIDQLTRDDTRAQYAAQEVLRGAHSSSSAMLAAQLKTVCVELDRSCFLTCVAAYKVLEDLTTSAYPSLSRDDRGQVHRVLAAMTRTATTDFTS